jgi:type VI secretion system secreted protein Hcp
MAIYMKFGDTIKGEVTHDDHKDWIEIHSLSFGVGRAVMTPTGSAANREATQPSVSEITVTKTMDKASTGLFTQSVAGDDSNTVNIHFVATGSPGKTYAEYELTNVLVSGYSLSSGGDRPSESISLNFTKIEYKMSANTPSNQSDQPIIVSYDLATALKG